MISTPGSAGIMMVYGKQIGVAVRTSSDALNKAKSMQMVKIKIPDKSQSAKAVVEMSGRGRVLCFADDVYIVPAPALELLTRLGIHFQELGRSRSF
jgi:hypothetical protein